MKNYFFRGISRIIAVALLTMTYMVSCDKDPVDPPTTGATGVYIVGTGTALSEVTENGKMANAKNEVKQEVRGQLKEMYIAVKGGAEGFNIINVVKGVETSWGPGADFAEVLEADLDNDEPKKGLWKGSYQETDSPFTVPEDGLYYVALDTELGTVVIAKVVWGLIGGATPGGWSTDTELSATFDLNTMEFSVEDVVMKEDEYKFRFSGGWKIILDADYDLGGGESGIKVNTNLGGTIDALEAGGDNMAHTELAKFKVTLTWTLGGGYAASMEKTGEADEVPDYPENLYMIGASIGGWDWEANGIQMNPVHSHDNAFWKIVWIENGATDPGVKFAPAKEWNGDFGVADDTQPAVGDHLKGSSNIPEPAESGYYMVWVDLERDSISVTEPEVYLLGATLGEIWDTPYAEAKFTVDNPNEKLTITKDLSAGELRMYAWHKWHYDWWQQEFMVLNNMIEYRGTGGDQERVNLTAGNTTIDLNFKTGEGSITQ